MANRLKGEVAVEADGKTYTLVFSINALCELEEKLGESVSDIGSLVAKGKRFSTIRTVFWAGLRDYHPEVDIKEAGRIINAVSLETADAAVGEAFSLAFPEAKAPPLPLTVAKPARNGRARTGLQS